MDVVITVLHVVACIFLIAVVLLQRGKGAQIGAVFGGGGGATMFGGRGAGNFLTKLTAGAAITYMVTSLSLSYLGLMGAGDRLFEEGAPETATEAEKPLFEDLGATEIDIEADVPVELGEAPAAETPETEPESPETP